MKLILFIVSVIMAGCVSVKKEVQPPSQTTVIEQQPEPTTDVFVGVPY